MRVIGIGAGKAGGEGPQAICGKAGIDCASSFGLAAAPPKCDPSAVPMAPYPVRDTLNDESEDVKRHAPPLPRRPPACRCRDLARVRPRDRLPRIRFSQVAPCAPVHLRAPAPSTP